MPKLKYFNWIDNPDFDADPGLGRPLPDFDFASMAAKSTLSAWLQRFALRRILPVVAFLLRWAWPIPRIGRVILVTRRADAAEVLGDMDRFKVIYGPEMRFLGGGVDNVLSVDDGRHERFRTILSANISSDDIDKVAVWSRQSAEQLMAAGGGRLDVMRDLLTRSAAEASARWLGLTTHDPDGFAEWTMAVSGMIFGDYFAEENARKQAAIGSAHLCGLIDDAISRVHFNNLRHPNSTRPRATLIDKLVTDGRMSDEEIRAAVIGLATAFVPTNTLAGGNMLEELMSSPERFGEARRAAMSGDKAKLLDLLLEAGRRNPALSPGLWRHIPRDADATTIAGGHWRRRRARPGDAILVLIPSALRDGRKSAGQAGDYDDPKGRAWMMFGSGPHDCLGARLALAHLTEVFAVLLAKPALTPVRGKHGHMVRTGPYPTRLDMQWDAPLSQRANVLAALPIRDGASIKSVEEELIALGDNPVHADLRRKLDATGVILFTSTTVVETGPGSTQGVLLIEINADGTRESAIHAYCDAAFDFVAPALRHCTVDGQQPTDTAAMARLITSGAFDLHQKPWGNSGLHFDGLPQLSVADIDRQQRLAAFAREALDKHQSRNFNRSSRAMDALLFVRRLIKQDSFYALKVKDWGTLFQKASAFEYAVQRPSRSRLAIADWNPPKSIFTPIWPMLTAADNRWILFSAALLLLAFALSIGAWLWPAAGASWLDYTWTILSAFAGSLVATSLTGLFFAGLFVWRLRSLEKRDISDGAIANLDEVRRIAAKEDAPFFEQNHIVALMPFKPGWFRRLTFAFSMWGIKQAVTYWFRPGFVVTMGTIHKARWFRLPGTKQFVFFSNYDGSWESYLEDFITRAHEGQTAAWSHGIGFPPSRFLILDGAEHGDRFKRWVRRQQRITPLWYSRFPGLTAKQIRANAMIEDGLARAASDTDARRWLGHFGSAQREPQELETGETQSIAFAGFGKHPFSTALAFRLPDDPKTIAQWMAMVSGMKFTPPSKSFASAKAGMVIQRPNWSQLSDGSVVRFGDVPAVDGGAALALTAEGLRKCGLQEGTGLEQFPAAFRMTMAGRSRVLGDTDGIADWRFHDAVGDDRAVDGILILYHGEQSTAGAPLAALHRSAMAAFGIVLVHEIPCSPVIDAGGKPNPNIEHFGFRDGISQPVIAGTRKAEQPSPARDIVQPGEFLLGYPNDQGFVAPPISIGAELDPANNLPSIAASTTNRYPFFGNRTTNPDLRDFGRNGSFLVVRQLDQDTEKFSAQLSAKAKELKDAFPYLSSLQGRPVDAEWLGAKIIGRWKDGTPLIGNPIGPKGLGPEQSPNNDFAYGQDDPRGLACPLGSHIRRTNPRDSLEPGDPDEQRITNRHRLLRRGRSYHYSVPGQKQPVKGLLFMALCSDLERQFEFVQHTWVNSTSFHGLNDEADPLLGSPSASGGSFIPAPMATPAALADEDRGRPTRFSIPTETGTVCVKGLESYVTLQGGGYFFLPSRAAIQHLIFRMHQSRRGKVGSA